MSLLANSWHESKTAHRVKAKKKTLLPSFPFFSSERCIFFGREIGESTRGIIGARKKEKRKREERGEVLFTLEISCKNEIALEETRTFTSHKSGAVLENWKISCRKRRRNWGKSAILSLCHRELEIRSRKLRKFPKRQSFERTDFKGGIFISPRSGSLPPPSLPPLWLWSLTRVELWLLVSGLASFPHPPPIWCIMIEEVAVVRSNTENRFDSTDFSEEKNRLLPTARATPKSSQKKSLARKKWIRPKTE